MHCLLLDKKSAVIDGTFSPNDVKIVFKIDDKAQATYFSETGNGE